MLSSSLLIRSITSGSLFLKQRTSFLAGAAEGDWISYNHLWFCSRYFLLKMKHLKKKKNFVCTRLCKKMLYHLSIIFLSIILYWFCAICAWFSYRIQILLFDVRWQYDFPFLVGTNVPFLAVICVPTLRRVCIEFSFNSLLLFVTYKCYVLALWLYSLMFLKVQIQYLCRKVCVFYSQDDVLECSMKQRAASFHRGKKPWINNGTCYAKEAVRVLSPM